MKINDNIRKVIVNDIETIIINKYIGLKEAIKEYVNMMYPLLDHQENKKDMFKIMFFCGVIYTDAYSLFNYKQSVGIATNYETELFSQIIQIEDFDDLLSEISCNPELFAQMIECCVNYDEVNYLMKRMITKSLSASQVKQLVETVPFYQEEIEEYGKEVTINDLVHCFEETKEIYTKKIMIDFDEGIYISMKAFLRQLISIDIANANKLFLELAQFDYVVKKYLCERGIDFYETLMFYKVSRKEEIIKRISSDDEFLTDALESLIAIKVRHVYEDIKLNDDIFDEEDILRKKFIM